METLVMLAHKTVPPAVMLPLVLNAAQDTTSVEPHVLTLAHLLSQTVPPAVMLPLVLHAT